MHFHECDATNAIAADASELEIMSCIAQFARSQEKAGDKPDWDTCVQAACAGNPPCAEYANVLARFAREYGGGPGAPLVFYLDNFAKKHSQHLILGQEYISAVCDAKFGMTKPCAYVRAALMATNMTATKAVDNIAKLMTKADVMKLQSKEKLPKVHQLDQDLQGLEALLVKLDSMQVISLADSMDHLFLCMIRAVTHLVSKTKLTFLHMEYKDMDTIMGMFHEELNAALPEDAKEKAAKPEAEAKAASSTDKPMGSSDMVSFDTLMSPEHIASQKGFAIGGTVLERCVGPSKLYIIKRVADNVDIETRVFIPGVLPQKASMALEVERTRRRRMRDLLHSRMSMTFQPFRSGSSVDAPRRQS